MPTLPPNVEKKVIDGKEYIVVKSSKPPVSKREKNRTAEDAATVAYFYPQYTLKDIDENLPAYQVAAMIKVARREQANFLLLLNGIIHGPNAKNKQPYKKLLKNLAKQSE